MKNLSFSIAFVCLSLILSGQAQENFKIKHGSKWDFGIGLGLSNSGTDTHSWGKHGNELIDKANLAWSANLKYHVSNSVAIRLDYFGFYLSSFRSNPNVY